MAEPSGEDAPEQADDRFDRWVADHTVPVGEAEQPGQPGQPGSTAAGPEHAPAEQPEMLGTPMSAETEPDVTDEPPAAAEQPDEQPTAESSDEPSAPSWIDRMRTSRTAEPEPDADTDADATDVPATPEPEPAPSADWRHRFRTAVERQESDEEQSAPPADAPTPGTPAPAATPAATPAAAPSPPTGPRTTPAEIPDPYEFAPRVGTRRLVTLVFVAGVLATAYLARAAYREPDQTSIALAATAAFATAVLWAVRASTTVTRLRVEDGQLEVVRDGDRSTFDLTSTPAPLEVVGTPGRRGWKALFARPGSAPFVIDSSIVDPEEFMRVVRYHRPGESPESTAAEKNSTTT